MKTEIRKSDSFKFGNRFVWWCDNNSNWQVRVSIRHSYGCEIKCGITSGEGGRWGEHDITATYAIGGCSNVHTREDFINFANMVCEYDHIRDERILEGVNYIVKKV